VDDTPPDLPAMLLRTEHIAESGVDEEVFPYGGTCFTPEQDANNLARSRTIDVAKVLDELTGTGYLGSCGQPYAVPQERADPDARAQPALLITTYVHL
jgi:hypothetical protein